MDSAQIQAQLERLFDGDASNGIVVVWHDPYDEFQSILDTLELPDVEVLREAEGHSLELKIRINEPLDERKILLYRPGLSTPIESDWLADVEHYATAFRADLQSLQMVELGLEDTPELRTAVARHRDMLKDPRRYSRLLKLCSSERIATPKSLDLAIMSAALGSDSILDEDGVIVAFLDCGTSSGVESVEEKLVEYGISGRFRSLVEGITGFMSDDLTMLGRHVIVSAVSDCIPQTALAGLEGMYSVVHAGRCHSIVRAWESVSEDARSSLRSLCDVVSRDCNLRKRLSSCELEEILACDVVPDADSVILEKLVALDFAGDGMRGAISAARDARKGLPWFSRLSSHYDMLSLFVDLKEQQERYIDGFEWDDGAAVWNGYVNDIWRVDYTYRKFHCAFRAALQSGILTDKMKGLAAKVEGIYKNWFLVKLSSSWENLVEDNLTQLGFVSGIERQQHFWESYVDSLAAAKARAYVIVSDALRFEVAKELGDRLEAVTQGRVKMDSVQAAFPSITACGMPALLPHGTYKLLEDAHVLVDGVAADGKDARQKVLRARISNAVAITADEFLDMTSRERRGLVKGVPVVFIYHNTIDAEGDNPKTERKVFEACEQAINEIVSVVRTIVGDFSGTNVIITSDHGFLYTYERLRETDRQAETDITGVVTWSDRRAAIAKAGATSATMMRVDLSASGAQELVGFAPRGITRIKHGGAGENYVHGGVSIQELCVPVLSFKNYRSNAAGFVSTEKASISLISSNRTISNNLFRLGFLQDQPVGGKVLVGTWDLFLADSLGNPITDTVRVIADKADTDATKRDTRAPFAIKAGVQTSSSERYFLICRDVDDSSEAWREEFQVKIAFARSDDFDW